MINIAVCDDLSASRIKIDTLLAPYKGPDSLAVYDFSSGEELLAFPNYASTFSIVFLDVEMGDISGLDVARDIREKNKDVIIFFITSYINYVPDSFRLGAFQFLVKPINDDDFKKDFERALNTLRSMHTQYRIKWRDVNHVVEYKDIFYIEAYNRHLFIHEEENGYECIGKLQDECEKLKHYGFSRCHQGFLINLSKVRKIDKKSVVLNNGVTIPISRQYKQSLMQDFNLYLAGISL